MRILGVRRQMSVLSFAVAGAMTLSPISHAARVQSSREIARLVADFNRDRRPDTLSIRALSRRPIRDTSAWCGAGVKDTGRFEAVVRLAGHQEARTLLNDLFGGESLGFTAGRWRIASADYNGDGRPDFNLGQYASCNGWQYSVFSVTDDGRVVKLRVEHDAMVRASDDANSTKRLEPVTGGFRATWYDNTRGNVETLYCWRAPAAMFVIADERRIDTLRTDAPPRAGCSP